ncbi:DUF424 domain-containing protein [Halomicroarcula sp. F13]|uniref:DUF424 domain-containing protein n=1 Tax=Haloarcula rubra TaxID=2487747 RepID=A0AAW4PUE8_9EURY|nr:DUF424 domain-containing protein [Halomicroarcula rubra]MBX0324150.1 DUF424 domain-containing protein [Halomicroarcula rubra]
MILNERETDEGLLVSVCDPEVMGETFEDGPVSLTVDESFYGGDSVSEEEVVDSLARCSVANIVGENSVDVAVEHGFVDETNVLDVDGTRHAQLLWL